MESIREIFVPATNKLELNIPDHFIGKTIEVIAFEIEEKKRHQKILRKNL
jgi:hypothetical protein